MAEEELLSAIKKLDSWLLDKAEPIGDFFEYTKETVGGVKNNLQSILDFLINSTHTHNKLLNHLIADVVEMAHDAQVLIEDQDSDEYAFYLKMEYIESGLWKLKLRLGGERRGAEAPLIPENDEMVGLEESIEFLLDKAILQEEEPFSDGLYTWCIVGVGGIGKTTLARELYNRAAVASRFRHRAWVCVSSVFSNKEVLMKLMRQLVVEKEGFEGDALLEEMERADSASLQQMLRQHLQSKRYFIVLDDVDEYTYLRSVLKALPQDKGSRLLLTSRTRNIRAPTNYDHEMKFLDGDKSWQLFLKVVFSGNTSDHKFPKKLEKRGRKMLEICGGLPLAITEVGRQLAIKRQSGSEWEELLESSIDLTATLVALEPSYHKLSPKEKSIFLCLSFFEEGTAVRVEKLLQIGIAKRIITSQEEGERALYALIRESFVEIKDETKDYKLKTLQIKVVFHRLSIKIAEEEINFEILRNNGNSPTSQSSHCVIYCGREKFNYSMNHAENIVSLFFPGGSYFDSSLCYWKRFQLLMILDMEGFGLEIVPKTIGMLTRLRYLGLRNNRLQKLPHWLSCLKNLEVLDIALNFMVEVPDIIWKLDSLCHLYMSNIICPRPLKIDTLENLQTLTYISVDNWTYELSGLQMMTRLRKAGIEELDDDSDVSKLFKSLAELEHLDSLVLRGFHFTSMPSLDEVGILHGLTKLKLDGLLTRLPSAKNFPPNIRYLTLVNSSLEEDPMLVLEKLSKLLHLRLQNAYTGQQMVISHDGFPNLVFLGIKELWHLRNVQVGKLAMPILGKLEINDCPYLETLPEVMSKLKELQIVTTKQIARNMKELSLISRISYVDIQP